MYLEVRLAAGSRTARPRMRILLPAGHFTHTGGHTRSIRTRIRILTFRFLRNPSVARCRGRDGAQGDEVGRRVRYAAYWSRGVE